MKTFKECFYYNKSMFESGALLTMFGIVLGSPEHVIIAFIFLFVVFSRLQEAKPDDIIELCKSTQ